LERWLKADRGLLVGRQDVVLAAADAALLLARGENGPVLQFQLGLSGAQVTALSLDGASRLVDMSAYDAGGRILLHGTLNVIAWRRLRALQRDHPRRDRKGAFVGVCREMIAHDCA
jgi:hypothetical protein